MKRRTNGFIRSTERLLAGKAGLLTVTLVLAEAFLMAGCQSAISSGLGSRASGSTHSDSQLAATEKTAPTENPTQAAETESTHPTETVPPTDALPSTDSTPQTPGQISIGSTSLNFGNTAVGSTTTLDVAITNAGQGDVIVSQAVVTGPAFSAEGIGANLRLTGGQVATLRVSFRPSAPGPATGSISLVSDAGGGPITIALAGAGAAEAHVVTLNWQATTGGPHPVGYFVYRRTASDDHWSKINGAPTRETTYNDSSVASGQTYYYTVSAVGSNERESTMSEQASALVPSP